MPIATDTASRLQRYIEAEAEILLSQRARMGDRDVLLAELAPVQAEIRSLRALLAREEAAAANVGRPRTFGSALSDFRRSDRY